jgi:hypothetical protein
MRLAVVSDTRFSDDPRPRRRPGPPGGQPEPGLGDVIPIRESDLGPVRAR